MTLTSPPPTVAPVTVDPISIVFRGSQDVQPFTYRSGMTYTQLLESIRVWLKNTLVPYLNTNFEDLAGSWEANVAAIDAAVNTALAEQATAIDAALSTQQAEVAQGLADAIASITSGQNTALYDAQIKSGLQSANSTALAFLDSRYQAEFALISSLSSAVSSLTGSIGANGSAIATINGTLAGRLADSALQNEFGDAAIAALIKSSTSSLGISFRRRLGTFVDDYGTVADGTTDDTAAIQAAFDAASAGGTVYFGNHVNYVITGTIKVYANTVIEFRGAQVKKKYLAGTNIYSTFCNAHASTSGGYGSGDGNITFRNGTISGDYSSSTAIDCAVALMHADHVRFQGMTFLQGNVAGHYLDLGGCRFVEVEDSKFLGGNVNTGVEQKESIQIDVATRDGSSNYTGVNAWPTTAYDGLPTRHVDVHDNVFTTLTIGGTSYPMANPMGCHSAALTTDSGYYEDITFESNTVEGWTKVPAQGATLAYGWLHFRGTRGLRIVGNVFRDTGAASRTGYPTIINVTDAPAVTAEADVATVGAAATTLGTTRYGYDVLIEGNTFLALNNTPNTAGVGHINVQNTVNATVRDNSTDSCSVTFLVVTNEGTVDDLIVADNKIRTTLSVDAIIVKNTVSYSITGNKIHQGSSSATGIHEQGCDSGEIVGNSISGGAAGITSDTSINSAIQNNNIRNFSSYAVSVGTTGAAGTAADVLVSGNRVKSTTSGAKGLINGTAALRTRQYGNHWNAPTAVADTGVSTVASAWSS